MVKSIRELEVFFHGTILDIGAGHSPYYSLISKNATLYIAMDYTSSLPAIESRKIERTAGVLEEVPLSSDSIHTVFCSQVFGYAKDPNCGMKEIFRVLRPGGHAIISVPHIAPIYDEYYDSYRFTPAGLSRLVQAHGGEIIRLEVQGQMFAAFALCLTTNLVANQLTRGRPFKFYRYRELCFAPLVCLINCAAWTLDNLLPWNRTPSNFIVVARKRRDTAMEESHLHPG